MIKSVILPKNAPKSLLLESLKPLAFIHSVNGEPTFTCYDCIMLSVLNECGYSIPNYIVEIGLGHRINIKAFKVSELGVEFGSQNIDNIKKTFQQKELSDEFYKEEQIILSNKLSDSS